jgi:hypothetical protein
MLNIKLLGVAFLIGIFLGLCGMFLTYKYTSNKYELEINRDRILQEEATSRRNAQVLSNERTNSAIISSLNEDVAKKQAKIVSLNANLVQLRDERGRLQPKPGICETGTPSGTTNVAQEPSSKFSTEFSRFLIERENEINVLRLYSETCNKYAAQIMEQRERMMKENNSE